MIRSDRPLTGRTILLTRPRARGRGLASRLTELGARVEERPTIEFAPPPNTAAVAQAVAALERYDWIVFSSPTGVDAFVKSCRESSIDPSTGAFRIAAVGRGTASLLEGAGLQPGVVAETSRAEGLLEALEGQIEPRARVLWVRPEVAREVLGSGLETMGAEVDPVAFYRTVPTADAGVTAERLRAADFDVVVFTSPSTLECLLGSAGARRAATIEALDRLSIVAIGPVTAAAIEESGLRSAAVARAPDEASVLAAILGLDGAADR